MRPLLNIYAIPYLRVKSYSSTIQFYSSLQTHKTHRCARRADRVRVLHYPSNLPFTPTQQRMMHRRVQIRRVSDQHRRPRNVLIPRSFHRDRRHRALGQPLEGLLGGEPVRFEEGLVGQIQPVVHSARLVRRQREPVDVVLPVPVVVEVVVHARLALRVQRRHARVRLPFRERQRLREVRHADAFAGGVGWR